MVLIEVVTVPNFSALTSHSTYLLRALLAIWFMLTLPSEESPSIFLSTSRSIRNVLVTVSGERRPSVFEAVSSCVTTDCHILWHLQSSTYIKINLAFLSYTMLLLVKVGKIRVTARKRLQMVSLHTRRKAMPCIQAICLPIASGERRTT